MPLRELVPKQLQGTVRSTYISLGRATAPLRLEPSFIIIGGQRCGTTSIWKGLAEHPQILRPPVDKGIDYFTLNYYRSRAWYNGHFPVASLARRRTARYGPPAAFEACTYYMFHPFAMERLAKDLPNVKLVAMLRDPVERAYSAYKHEFARGYETATFDEALELEDSRLEGEYEKMRDDLTYESHAHRHQAYRRRGNYAEQLERVFSLFPREQVHVLESEAFFANPGQVYDDLLSFLEVSPFRPSSFDQHNARPGSGMSESARDFLTDFYRPCDEKLADLLGRKPHWVE